MPKIDIRIINASKTAVRLPKIEDFKQKLKTVIETGEHEEKRVNDLHSSQLEKEVIDNLQVIDNKSTGSLCPVADPLEGHEVTKEYRTKMTDWMVEVCTSFKCSKRRTYYVAVQLFDKYLTKIFKNQGKVLQNKDVHSIGVAAMFLSSKYEDVLPLSSKVVSEKIAHRAIPAKELLKKEGEFLNLFEFEIDFITHYDFY